MFSVGCSVINQVQFWVVRDPSPNASPANFPRVGRPSLHTEVLASILRIKWFESRADQHIFIRSCGVGPPCYFPGLSVKSRQPTSDSKFPSTISYKDFPFDY